jgi:hypothetical protein
MLFEIINPSDRMTIEADSVAVAGVAIMYLSEGGAALKNEDGKTVLPILALGGDEDVNLWLDKVGIGSLENLKSWLYEHRDEVAVALESIVYGSFDDRRDLMAEHKDADHIEFLKSIAEWNNEKRSSMNDYSRAAFFLAKRIRELEP